MGLALSIGKQIIQRPIKKVITDKELFEKTTILSEHCEYLYEKETLFLINQTYFTISGFEIFCELTGLTTLFFENNVSLLQKGILFHIDKEQVEKMNIIFEEFQTNFAFKETDSFIFKERKFKTYQVNEKMVWFKFWFEYSFKNYKKFACIKVEI